MSNPEKISQQLLNYARKDEVNYQLVLTRFFHERILYRIGESHFKNSLILKGGNLIYAIHGMASRPTIDIDLLGTRLSNNLSEISEVFRKILSLKIEDGVYFEFDCIKAEEIDEQNKYNGIRLKFKAFLGNINQYIQVDIGFGDKVTPAPQELSFPVLIDGFATPSILSYSRENAIAEKLHATLYLGLLNSRMKDFYDIHTFIKEDKINRDILKDAINETFKNRNTELSLDSVVFTENFYTNKDRVKMWKSFLNKIGSEDIDFKEVVIEMKEMVETIL